MRISFTTKQLELCLQKARQAKETGVAHECFSVHTKGIGFVQVVAYPSGQIDVSMRLDVAFEKGRT